jgi:hypothetical protein
MGEGEGGMDYEMQGGEEDGNSRERRGGTAMGEPHLTLALPTTNAIATALSTDTVSPFHYQCHCH